MNRCAPSQEEKWPQPSDWLHFDHQILNHKKCTDEFILAATANTNAFPVLQCSEFHLVHCSSPLVSLPSPPVNALAHSNSKTASWAQDWPPNVILGGSPVTAQGTSSSTPGQPVPPSLYTLNFGTQRHPAWQHPGNKEKTRGWAGGNSFPSRGFLLGKMPSPNKCLQHLVWLRQAFLARAIFYLFIYFKSRAKGGFRAERDQSGK